MKLVRDFQAAKWLPSRHHFALARLIAFVISRVEDNRPRLSRQDIDHLLLAIDRDQSALENYGVSIWLFCTVVTYLAALLPLPTAVGLLVAVPLATVAIQLPIYISGLLLNNRKVNAVCFMALMVVASSYFAAATSPIRYVAWFFLAVVILNSLAWLIMAMLRDRVRALEQRCGI